MMSRFARASAIILLLAGCNSNPIEDKLAVTFAPFSTPVKVDTSCDNGGCNSRGTITATVAFKPDAYLAPGTQVEFRQYRVQYDIAGLLKKPPYFAGPLNLVVSADQTASFTVYAAGQNQRDSIRRAVGDKTVRGTATLTLAGYDNNDDQVFLDKEFDISFGDF